MIKMKTLILITLFILVERINYLKLSGFAAEMQICLLYTAYSGLTLFMHQYAFMKMVFKYKPTLPIYSTLWDVITLFTTLNSYIFVVIFQRKPHNGKKASTYLSLIRNLFGKDGRKNS